MLHQDVDIDVAWLMPLKLWALATAEVAATLPQASVSEKHLDDITEARCIEMELHTYGCIDARLP